MGINNSELLARLLEKANSLPMTPGVYIMKDSSGTVIYVGKSRKLKARVSQYFQSGKKNIKTDKMVRSVRNFEYILCDTEIEALSLENTLIKQYSPRYNIRLKDAKSYPYIKVNAEMYPRLTVTRTRANDKALYFGPYSGTATAYSVINTLQKTLGLPTCKRSFPKDIGKERPCLYYQMGRCCGVCADKITADEYGELIKSACEILRGNTASVRKKLEKDMFRFADEERFEAAARCRDTIASLNLLTQKQHVVSAPGTELDAIGLYSDDTCSAISVMYVRDGALSDRAVFTFGADEITEASDLVAFLSGHYQARTYIPKNIYISFELPTEEEELFEKYLFEIAGRKINILNPQRGNHRSLCELAVENAAESAKQFSLNAQKDAGTLEELANLLHLECFPERIEAYDISNLGQEHLTAGMIVCENGNFLPSDYRIFKIKNVVGTDDYASMREALSRRFAHLSDETGAFSKYPDIILLDGGRGHVSTVRELMRELNIDIPIFGMVKDDKHRTRALTTETEEISITDMRRVFVLIYKIQEEVHRFTVSKMHTAKAKNFRRSSLENITGIGPAKAKALLSVFGGIQSIKEADAEVLKKVKGITASDAENIIEYFKSKI